MVKSIILIENIVDLQTIQKNLIDDPNNKKISLDYEVHNKLELEKIDHQIGEELLDQDERLQIFDKVTEFRNWYSNLLYIFLNAIILHTHPPYNHIFLSYMPIPLKPTDSIPYNNVLIYSCPDIYWL